MKKYLYFSACLAFITILSVAAIEGQTPEQEFKNLKVLPKDISRAELRKIMENDCNKALGVTCNYCHASTSTSDSLDYARDEKAEKKIARKMMRMTLHLNEKYFAAKNPRIGDSVMSVTCITCHKGDPYPNR